MKQIISRNMLVSATLSWKRNGIKIRTGLTFAPKNLSIIRETGHEQEYFSWYEAIELEQCLLRPYGWRLPTAEEWENVIRVYMLLARMINKLKLSYDGRIDPVLQKLVSYGLAGYFWSSTQDGYGRAYSLDFAFNDRIAGLYSCNKENQFAVRCVRDT